MMSQERLTASAMLTAPFVVCVTLMAFAFIAVVVTGDGSLSFLFPIVLLVSAFNAGITWTLGLAWHALLMRLSSPPPLLLYALPGAIFGGLVMRGLEAYIFRAEFIGGVPYAGSAAGALFGSVTASLFWFMRRPDLDEPNPPTSS